MALLLTPQLVSCHGNPFGSVFGFSWKSLEVLVCSWCGMRTFSDAFRGFVGMAMLFLPSSCCESRLCSQGEGAAWWCSETSAHCVPCDVCNKQCHSHAAIPHPQWEGASLPGEPWLQLESSALVRVAGAAASQGGWGRPSWQVDAHEGSPGLEEQVQPSSALVCLMGRDGHSFGSPAQQAVASLDWRACRTKPHRCARWGTAASSVVGWKRKLWPSPMLCVGEIWGPFAPVRGCQMVVIQVEQRLPSNGGGGH